jgi:hypothetical protein
LVIAPSARNSHVARREASGDADRVRRAPGIEPEQIRRGDGRAEHPAHRGGMVPLVVEQVGIDRLADPRGDVVAGDHRREEAAR